MPDAPPLAGGEHVTQLGFSAILRMHKNDVSKSIQEYQRENDEFRPLRSHIHGCGLATSHKVKIISLYQKGFLTPEIAKHTKHSPEAVGRYIKGYEMVLALAEKVLLDKISRLRKMHPKLVKEYLDIANNGDHQEHTARKPHPQDKTGTQRA